MSVGVFSSPKSALICEKPSVEYVTAQDFFIQTHLLKINYALCHTMVACLIPVNALLAVENPNLKTNVLSISRKARLCVWENLSKQY